MSVLTDVLSGVGDVLAFPGQVVRGGLRSAYGLANNLFGGDMDPSFKLTSGQELLGLDDSMGGTLGGIAADIATDPLTYLGGFLAKRLMGRAAPAAAVAKAAPEELASPLARAISSGGAAEAMPMATQVAPKVAQAAEVLPEAVSPLTKAITSETPQVIPMAVKQAEAVTPALTKASITVENIDGHRAKLQQAWQSMKKNDFAKWMKDEYGLSVHGTKEEMNRQASNFLERIATTDLQVRY